MSIAVKDEGKKATSISYNGCWCNIKTREMFSPGRDSVHFKIVSMNTAIMIGMASGDLSPTEYAGRNSNGWSYDSRGTIYNNTNTLFTGPTYNSGDKITIKIDFDLKRRSFYKNNQLIHIVHDIPTNLYPAVSFCGTDDAVEIIAR